MGAEGAGYPPKHSTGAAGTTTENGMHPRREYNKVASEALMGGQANAGMWQTRTAMGPHHTAWDTRRRGGGDEKPPRASSGREPYDRETEERGPPNGRARLTQAAAEGEKGEEKPPTSSARPWRTVMD